MEGGGETEIVSLDGLEFISALIRENVQKKVQMNIPSLTFEPVIQKKKQLPLNLSSRWLPFIWAPLNYSPAKFSWNRLFAPAAVDSLSLFCNQNVLFSYVMIHLSLWWSEGLEEGAWAASFLTGSPCFTCTEPSWVSWLLLLAMAVPSIGVQQSSVSIWQWSCRTQRQRMLPHAHCPVLQPHPSHLYSHCSVSARSSLFGPVYDFFHPWLPCVVLPQGLFLVATTKSNCRLFILDLQKFLTAIFLQNSFQKYRFVYFYWLWPK